MSLFYYGVCILAVVLGWCLLRAAKKGDKGLELMDLEMIQAQQDAFHLKPRPTPENLEVTTDPDLNIVTPAQPGVSSDEESSEAIGSSHRQLQENQSESWREPSQILPALLKTKWHKTNPAQPLQWSRMTLCRKMEKYRVPSLRDEDGGQRLTTLESDRKLH